MSKRLIITEEEKKTIRSLYEQTNDQYKKENDFLKRYVGKTFNLYTDNTFKKLSSESNKITDIVYKGGHIKIKFDVTYKRVDNEELTYKNLAYIECEHNPNRLGYKCIDLDTESELTHGYPNVYNKSLIDDINKKGTELGIKWCQLPKADFGMNNMDKNNIG